MNSDVAFSLLCQTLHVWPDRRGEVSIPCPKCGHKSFSFCGSYGHCFRCGYGPSLTALAETLGIRVGEDYVPASLPHPAPSKPEPEGIWIMPNLTPDGLAGRFSIHSQVVERWQAYCPALTKATIDNHLLGYGAYPYGLSRCPHERLQIPLFDRNCKVVGFRSRQCVCDCRDKSGDLIRWTSALGTRPVLYGYDVERFPYRKVIPLLVVTESPVDVMLLEQLGVLAVGTLGVANWKKEWVSLFLRAKHILIAYDNDPAGNGGTEEARAEWFADHPNTPANFEAGGARLANRLLKAGCQDVKLYPWPKGSKPGQDVRDVLGKVAA